MWLNTHGLGKKPYFYKAEDLSSQGFPFLAYDRDDDPSYQSILQNFLKRFPAEFCPTFKYQVNTFAQALATTYYPAENSQVLPVVCLGKKMSS